MNRFFVLIPETSAPSTIQLTAQCHAGTLTVSAITRWPEELCHREMWKHLYGVLFSELGTPCQFPVRDLTLLHVPDSFLKASVLSRQMPDLKRRMPDSLGRTRTVEINQAGTATMVGGGIPRDRALTAGIGLLTQGKVKIAATCQLADEAKQQLSRISARRAPDGRPEEIMLAVSFGSVLTEHFAKQTGGMVRLRYS